MTSPEQQELNEAARTYVGFAAFELFSRVNSSSQPISAETQARQYLAALGGEPSMEQLQGVSRILARRVDQIVRDIEEGSPSDPRLPFSSVFKQALQTVSRNGLLTEVQHHANFVSGLFNYSLESQLGDIKLVNPLLQERAS